MHTIMGVTKWYKEVRHGSFIHDPDGNNIEAMLS